VSCSFRILPGCDAVAAGDGLAVPHHEALHEREHNDDGEQDERNGRALAPFTVP